MTLSSNKFPPGDSRVQLLRQLRQLVEGRGSKGESQKPESVSGPRLSTLDSRLSCGIPAIDRLLPGGGLRRGMLVEWVGENGKCRITNDERKKSDHSSFVIRHSLFSFPHTLSLLAAREACRAGGVLVVVDPARTFYPPAAVNWGIDINRLIVVRPRDVQDALWAAVQSLRSPAVAATWIDASLGLQLPAGRAGYREAALGKAGHDERAFRRLQLAAQAGRTLGLVVRPASVRGQSSWADVRLGICPLSVVRCPLPSFDEPRTTDHGRFLQVHLLRCRHGRAGGAVTLEIDDATYTVREARVHHDAHPLPVAPKLANSTMVRGAG
jgi:hypothetical protein